MKFSALFISIILHICGLILVCIFAVKQITVPPSGVSRITVHLVTLAQSVNSQTTPVKEMAKLSLAKTKPNAISKLKPKVLTEIPASKNFVQEAHWQEAKSNNISAKILYQPMPKIPEDLRHETFSTSAGARFNIAADSSVEVELLSPSQNPRLNHILLETLRAWKFTPATQNGVAINSILDINVHFAVE